MTLILAGSDNGQAPLPIDMSRESGAALVHTAYEPTAFRAATATADAGTAEQHLSTLALVDNNKCAQPKGFWERMGEAISRAAVIDGYAEANLPVPPEVLNPPEPACKAEVPVKPQGAAGAGPSADVGGKPGADAGGKLLEAPPPGAKGEATGPVVRIGDISTPSSGLPGVNDTDSTGAGAGKDGLVTRLGDISAVPPVAVPPEQGKEQSGPVVHLGDLSGPEGATLGGGQPPKDQPAKPVPGQDMLNPLLGGVIGNIGKSVQELEPGINPRLGCVRMVSHAMHEADPSFPETNNAAAFRRALKEHGYEEVTVKPGDPALSGSHAGDVLVGHRPDGMPSHAAINMGDGTVFNNNSNTGKGQMDGLDQFNQGMHDSKGHWMKNGFDDVTIYRKKASA